ncbi:4-hydroxy-3-methylbut-2-enyl diphosphate reductase [Anaerovirgula multivorans]|uniref:4-hydroxy-3-methylbut-2-enyl diphosphate reductase n=1 Tax=Anaerovirgula multivorans TaxID=312168 RepID=A0A238ZZG7_9FIRM|nr:4-hydroxy-3-methylbut-2-enyl diphosphate reductase [Anaerovirgula multivorans]SNR88248.1 4-hydroxy-3-methylbut-2-enyl diphosphate reductase [Anaerovirgula multivorans]
MKVILADYSGFCFGVEKAINTTFEELEKKQVKDNISSLGPLIHNNQVVKDLEEKGVKVFEDINDISTGSVIVRSHGVSEEIYEIAKDKGLNIIDATCPFVRRIQNIAKKYHDKGYTIAIIGNPKHPEVIGINGWCNNEAIIIKDEENLKQIPKFDKLCVVAQTTMSVDQYEKIIEQLENYANEIVKFNTICSATKERQLAAKNLAEKVEAMIVIGGYHSSNTQKLVSICEEIKPDATYHVETVEDLPLKDIKQYKIVGVTAGASTPKWIINEIIHKLSNI